MYMGDGLCVCVRERARESVRVCVCEAALKSSWLKSGVDPPTENPEGVDPGSPILVQI